MKKIEVSALMLLSLVALAANSANAATEIYVGTDSVNGSCELQMQRTPLVDGSHQISAKFTIGRFLTKTYVNESQQLDRGTEWFTLGRDKLSGYTSVRVEFSREGLSSGQQIPSQIVEHSLGMETIHCDNLKRVQ